MIAGLGLAALAIPQNANGQKAVGAGKIQPLEERESSEATSLKTKDDSKKNTLSRPVEPIAPSSFKTLLQIQGEEPASAQASPFSNELTPEEEKQVRELKKIDAEVRAHEAAHKTAGGPVAGNVTFETVTGPDGREYAVAGEVQIDASPVPNNPKATVRKMELVIRAALAPAEPSPQDRAVAAQAQQIKLKAQQEASKERAKNRENYSKNNNLVKSQKDNDLQQKETVVDKEANLLSSDYEGT